MSLPSQTSTDNAESEAFRSLEAVCDTTGLDRSGANLLRLGSNAVFRLPAARVIVRIARTESSRESAAQQVAVARWLDRESVPAVRAFDIDQPVVAGEAVATIWESVSEQTKFGTTAELGSVLRQLHQKLAPAALGLREFDRTESETVAARLESAKLADEDRALLRDRFSDAAARYNRLRFVLPHGVIHGDANVGNLLCDDAGNARLADLDGFSIGPREWDLILTAMYYHRYGWHTQQEYRAFAAAYGFDVMAWDGYETIADLRELLMVVWLADTVGADASGRAELAARLESIRNNTSRRHWQPR